ncbi:MAG: 4-hydroxyphenylpyruvate dioxygenase [Bdellovibrionota bacterium]|nr:MAG: 4-hydroxyphenylpyruvate dioxygenase [Bdellovibrionota bacterium]
MTSRWIDTRTSNETVPDPLAISNWDHIEIYCDNARQAAHFYMWGFGFRPIAYRGPETGHRESASYVLAQGEIRLVLTSPLSPRHPIASQLLFHGDTVHSIALTVPHCEAYYHEAMLRGASSASAPCLLEDEHGQVKMASIRTYGDVQHPLVERGSYKGAFLPGFVPYERFFKVPSGLPNAGLTAIDHVVGNVELGAMQPWVDFYAKTLGFSQMQKFSDQDISTEYSALMSRVMADGSGKVKFPINEPAQGRRKSQIDEYLQFHQGPGVQHIALRTNDIISTVTSLRNQGIHFLRVPATYYDEVPKRVGEIKQDLMKVKELGILVDRDDEGYLLQLFTKPLQDRPTLFFELIQREGSRGFGIGNFKALFEAIEREQALRGNL